MCDPSEQDMVLICCWRDAWFFWVSGLPRAHSAPVASHFVVSSWRPVYSLKRCSFFSCILRLCSVPAVMLTSSAYPWSSYVMIAVVLLWGWYDGQYPRLPTAREEGFHENCEQEWGKGVSL